MEAFTRQEWEQVCDRCGLCCLVKLQDAESGVVMYTDVACQYLDIHDCRCTVYHKRQKRVAECLQLSPRNIDQITWLPPTCSYRLLRAGRPLPPWHPLVSGDGESVHRAHLSARHVAIAEQGVDPGRLVEHVINLAADGVLDSLDLEAG